MPYFPTGYGPQNPYMCSSFHLRRDINLVKVKDQQVISFINEMLPQSATTPYTIYSSGSLQFQSSYQPYYSERTLLWGRTSNGFLVSGMRWVPWHQGPMGSPTTNEVYPFREIYCPNIIYDIDKNVIHLWFWTNAKGVTATTTYMDVWNDKQAFHGGDWDAMRILANTPDVARVLCYTTGSFMEGQITGGFVLYETAYGDGVTPAGFQNTAQELIPVFCEPQMIFIDLTIQTQISPPGYQGIQGWQGAQQYGIMVDTMPQFPTYHGWDGLQSPFFPARITGGAYPNHTVDIYDNGKQAPVTRPGMTMFVPDGQFMILPVGAWVMGMQNSIY